MTGIRIKSFARTISVYATGAAGGVVLFIVLFHTPILESMDVLFYRGIGLLMLSCFIMAGILIWATRPIRTWFTRKDIVLCTALFFSFSLVFFTLIPVTAERSVSIFFLTYMQSTDGKSVTKDDLSRAFVRDYIGTYDNTNKRIHEQLVTGDIQKYGNGYVLTQRGRNVLKMYAIVSTLFGIDKKLIGQK